MPAKVRTDLELMNVLMRKTKGPTYFKAVKDFLQEQSTVENRIPQQCTVKLIKKIAIVMQEELAKKQFQNVSVIVKAVQFVARFRDFPSGLEVLMSNGLVNLLGYVLDETQKFLSLSDGSREDPAADSLMEVILETINDVADFSEEAKNESLDFFTGKLIGLLVSTEVKFQPRMEAVRTLNLLLEGCLNEVIYEVREHLPNGQLMSSLASLICTAGDFEMQVACTESLARLVNRSDSHNSELIQGWFANVDFADSFISIKDEAFETDCRKFLNYVNESYSSKQSVYSMPCISAYLGSSFKLRCPVDDNLKDFWVDFNTVSRRISLYVADNRQTENEEEGMWETVTIRQEIVQKLYISEKGKRQALFIVLTVPVSELLVFCPNDELHAQIVFDANLDVYTAAVAVFGQEKARRPKSKSKTSVSRVNVPVNLDVSTSSPRPSRTLGSAEECSDTMSLQNAPTYLFGLSESEEAPDEHEESRPPTRVVSEALERCKLSVPSVPMYTPTARLSRRNQPSSSNSEFTHPKTPIKSASAKRVKTPLQIVVSDKATESSSENAGGDHSSIRKKKASVSSGLSISSCGTPARLHKKVQETSHQDTSEMGDGGHKSDPGPVSSEGLIRQQEAKIDGNRSDPTHLSSKANESLPPQRRQLRSQAPKPDNLKASSTRLPCQDPSSSSGEEKDSKTKGPSRKFKLYSDDGNMMMEPGEASKEKVDADVIVPSSIPTQESVVVVPDSLPPSGNLLPYTQPLHDKPAGNSSSRQRKSKLLKSPQNLEDLSVYDFVDTESAHESIKLPRGNKKARAPRPAKALKKGKAPAISKQSKTEKPPCLKELSEEEQPRVTSSQKRRKPSKRQRESPMELLESDELPEITASNPRKRVCKRAFTGGEDLAEDATKGIAQRKAGAKNKKTSEVLPPSPKDLHVVQPMLQEISQIHDESPVEISDSSEQKDNPKHQRETYARPPSSPDDLSDIEEPRDAAPTRSLQLSTSMETEDYCDEDVHRFVRGLSNRQRQFVDREFTMKTAAGALDELLSDSRKTSRKNSVSKMSGYIASPGPAQVIPDGKREPNKTRRTSSTPRRQHDAQISSSPHVSSPHGSSPHDSSSHDSSPKVQTKQKSPSTGLITYGAEIVDLESEEVCLERVTESPSGGDGDNMETDSVHSFRKMCQGLILRSGQGLAANRPRRNIPRINYHYPDSSGSMLEEEEGHEEYQQENSPPSSTEESCLSSSIKGGRDVEAVSERSWLAEKPKQKVSTYSKTQSKEWVMHASIINLDTTVKKKTKKSRVPEKAVKRKQQAPSSVPKKTMKQSSKKTKGTDNADEDETSSLGMFMSCYYMGEEASISSSQPSISGSQPSIGGSQPSPPSSDEVHQVLSRSRSDKMKKYIPKRASNNPLVLARTHLSSSEDQVDDPSIEIARDCPIDIAREDIYPLSPLDIDEEVKAKILADFVTPKALSIVTRSTSSSGKTPKQVTFDSDPNYAEDLFPVFQDQDILKSGPSTWMRPSSSSLKRKYDKLLREVDKDAECVSDEGDGDDDVGGDQTDKLGIDADKHVGQGALKPKKLFKGALSRSTLEEDKYDDVEEEEIEGTDSNSTPTTAASPTSSSMPGIAQILKAVGESLNRKMKNKKTETQQLTEGAARSAQKQVSKLMSHQHRARNKAQEEFKNNLLKEVVDLEMDLEHLQDNYNKLKAVIDRHQRSVAPRLLQHVQRFKALQEKQKTETKELNNQLGRQLLQTTKQILTQEMSAMHRKLIQDAQQQELQQMRKRLHTMFML